MEYNKQSILEKLKHIKVEIRPNILQIKQETKRLMNDGTAIRQNIKNLKWMDKDAPKLYEMYKPTIRPDIEQKELSGQAAKIFRKLRKGLFNASSGISRCVLWQKKREIGVRARHLQLLYGLLRGKEYYEIELPNNKLQHNYPQYHILMSLLEEFSLKQFISHIDLCIWLGMPFYYGSEIIVDINGMIKEIPKEISWMKSI